MKKVKRTALLTLAISFSGLSLMSQNTMNKDAAKTKQSVDSKLKMDDGQAAKRKSPMKETDSRIGSTDIKVVYSAPSVRGRQIWGDLVPYNEVWRTGANEATTIEFSKDVMLNGNKLAAGKYALFTIPGEEEWTIIINKQPKQWGAFKYDKDKDALRFKVKPEKLSDMQEQMKFSFLDNSTLALIWDKLRVPIKISAK